jgi:hypothetical protein
VTDLLQNNTVNLTSAAAANDRQRLQVAAVPDRPFRPRVGGAKRAAVLATLLVGCAGDAQADIGLPMIAIYLPPAWLCFIPIVVIEAVVGIVRFKVAARRAFVAQTVANAVSTVVGLPVTWTVLAVMQLSCCGGAPGLDSPIKRLYAVTIQAPWLIPYESDLHWMVPAAFLVLTIPFYGMSVLSEYLVVRRFFPDLPKRTTWAWVTRANALSYALLTVVMLLSFLWPSVFEWVYGLFAPVTRALFDVVFWLFQGRHVPR